MKAPRRVAVVAIHGVGQHERNESAHALSRLLLQIPRGEPTRYTSFKEQILAIAARRVPEVSPFEKPVEHKEWKQLDERPEESAVSDGDVALDFMHGQLRDYSPEKNDGNYETIRLEGHRLDSNGEVEADVHIYEMYWNDLSRIGASVLGIFGAFYQLVIHLPYVGGWTLQHVREELNSARVWRMIEVIYAWGQRALTLVIPSLNILILALALTLLPGELPERPQRWAAQAAASVALLAIAIFLMVRTSRPRSGMWVVIPLVALAVGISPPMQRLVGSEWGAAAMWWVMLSVPLWLLFSAFQRNRPFARTFAIIGYTAIVIAVASYGFARNASATTSVLTVIGWLTTLLQLAWIVFGVSVVAATLTGFAATRLIPAGAKRKRAQRALYTSRLALALPAVAFSVATLLVWGGILAVADSRSSTLPEMARFWVATETVLGLASVAAVTLSLLLVVALMLPIVATEWSSPSTPSPDSSDAFARKSKRLGLWLSFTLRGSRLAGELLVIACLLSSFAVIGTTPVIGPALFTVWPGLAGLFDSVGLPAMNYGKWLVSGVGTAGLIALIDRVSRVGLGIRPILGIAVDVDNLRELPRDRTPRARMAERMTSLLRYLCEWRSNSVDSRSGYDVVVVVAHSQGTVIAADLLRYLGHLLRPGSSTMNCEPSLDRLTGRSKDADPLPIYLFTMGCPLRQLYALRFPHLYSWAGFDDENGPTVHELLAVKTWVNAYRSADYVGRSVWMDDDQSARTYDPFNVWESSSRAEWCVGPGAHTHYWDASADSIAATLDSLVSQAIDLPESGGAAAAIA